MAAAAFAEVDPGIMLTPLVAEGSRVEPDVELAHLRGRYSSILRAERVALNLLQRMSGIATMAARAVDLVTDLRVRIVDTRIPLGFGRFVDGGIGSVNVPVTGDVSAVVQNVTVTGTAGPGWVSTYPEAGTPPLVYPGSYTEYVVKSGHEAPGVHR